jgi:hypothetical protein
VSSDVIRRRKLSVPGGYRTPVVLAFSRLLYSSIPTHNVSEDEFCNYESGVNRKFLSSASQDAELPYCSSPATFQRDIG